MDEIINGTLAEAVEKIATMAAVVRTRGYAEKSAASDVLTSIGSAVRDNPVLASTILGGGLGAAVAGTGTALSNHGRDEGQKKRLLPSMLTGGLAGAGIGAGLGLARGGFSGAGSTGTDALKPGHFTDPTTGLRMMIDPKALKENPDLHRQIKALSTPSLQGRIAGGFGSLLQGIKDETPTSASVLPWVAGADLAMHAPGVGLARTTPEAAGGYWGRKFLDQGIRGAKELPDKLKGILAENAPPGQHGNTKIELPEHTSSVPAKSSIGKMWQRLRGTGGRQGVIDVLGNSSGGATGTSPALRVSYPEMREVEVGTNAGRGEKWKEQQPVTDAAGNPKITKHELNRGAVGALKGLGAASTEHFKDRSAYRVPFTNKMYRGSLSLGGALGRRAGFYGLPFAGEYLYRGMEEDVANRKSIQELMRQNAVPVPGQGG